MKDKSRRERNFLLMIMYESPWEKIMNFCWGIRKDPDDETFRWIIGDHPRGWRWVLAELAHRAELRDAAWRAKYVSRGANPPERWRRRVR